MHAVEGQNVYGQRNYYWNTTLVSSTNELVGVPHKEVWGSLTPDYYKKLRKNDLLPMTSWRKVLTEHQDTTWYQGSNPSGDHDRIPDYAVTPFFWDGGFRPTIRMPQLPCNAMLQKALANIYDYSFDLSTFIAEAPETFRLWSDTTRTLTKCFRRKRCRLRNMLDDGASTYLLGRYGYRPLLYDFEDMNELISKWHDPKKVRTGAIVPGPSGSLNEVTHNNISGTSAPIQIELWWQHVVEWETRGNIVADLTVDKLRANLLPTLWERLPFGFILDWWLLVGDALKAYIVALQSTSHTASCGYKITWSDTVGQTVLHTDPGYTAAVGGYLRHKVTEYRRVPQPVSFTPSANYKPLDAYQIADLVAILRSLVKRR